MAASPKPAVGKPAQAAVCVEVASLRLEDIVGQALQVGAESIHLQPTSTGVQVFFRSPGASGTQVVAKSAKDEYERFLAAVKARVGADPLKKDGPQKGQDLLEMGDEIVLISTVTSPCAWGETLLIRLEPEVPEKNLVDLGLGDALAWRAGLAQATGLCLVCGPAKAGKTTSLRASLLEIDRDARPSVMVADLSLPHVPEVWSIAPGMLKSQGLASFLPILKSAGVKVLVLDEIGNAGTAQAAVAAARSCLVLAGVQSELFLGAGIVRLRDWGVSENDLGATLRTVLLQRLLHATCSVCKGSGCAACKQTGSGKEISVFVSVGFDKPEAIQQLGQYDAKTPALVQAAADLCTQGLVPAEEIRRVFGDDAVPIHLRGAGR
jgi:type II secretory ATPase GspE/PulE/Tfp pilus assembly ATPase PilB-like protein